MTAMEWAFLGLRPALCLVQHVVEGAGELAPGELAEAMAIAAETSPGMRLVREGRRWVDSGVAPELHVLPPGAFDRGRLDSPALHRGLDGAGATCEAVLVPGTPTTPTTLVFRAFHGVTDARGLLLWMGDVFRVLRGEPPLGHDSPLNHHDLARSVAASATGLRTAPAAPLEWPALAGSPAQQTSRLLWRRRSVDGRHPASVAKVAAALAASTETGDGRFFVPVDLRRHAPELRSTAMLVHALRVDVAAGEDWQEVQRRLLGSLAEREELTLPFASWLLRMPVPAMRAVNAGIDRAARRRGRYQAGAYLSQLGGVDHDELSTDRFRTTAVYSLGGVSPGGPPEIDLLESPGRTEITVAWHDAPGLAERAEALLETAAEALSPAANRRWAGNRTDRPLPSERSVVELFREQVDRTPDRVALSGPEGKVTYAELSRRADAVATELRRQGVGPGTVVGLLADRTVAAMAGLWGVLRVGAAYLPLDTRHPDARIADLLTDSGSTFCLTQRPYDERACVPPGCRPLILDDLALDGVPPGEFQDAVIDPADLCYVIYTSGSTGRPKGVQIEHRALLNYVHWGTRAFGVDADTRLPLVTSLSFDVTGTSVFLPLLAGGEVVLMRAEPNHLSLRELLVDSGATMLNLTPSHLDLIGRLDLAPSGYRAVIVIGEQLRVEVAARAQQMFGPGCRIINEYGPTEATIGCTAHTFDPVRDARGAVVPIGLPADNTTVHLLDEDRRYVAPGEIGELHLGGAQLARGYLGRPDLNRERFVELADGTRVYRTGDLVRILPSGELECVGRIDDQVKIRGHRVEPAEVAQALEEHPAVDRAVVIARTRPGSQGGHGKSLYGYVLTNAPVTEDELAEHLVGRLPAYMLPAAVMALPELPYTVSGKVDARALPDPFAEAEAADARDAPDRGVPVDPVEEAVAGIWARTLGVPRSRLDGTADFHRLGGDSVALLAMLAGVCAEVLTPGQEKAFMAHLGSILREPTLGRVAELARAERRA
ncbi:amino acid adenylation domain-containing protein [Streptacidiphilus anmyonensis]|uniref:amino acid adenylation domain-containing protein n=1 Tax=Streptacidiphilus anmyonensis TaxID=405782 RepID=UPI0005AAC4A3|nr:amino acid adenylation domain-containing protein [Streptacidiphilus anmyonensis]